ncbi:hypothetical protein CHS0354_027210 [Potamilus streckersoni]|uniref:Uncharacterized protein n=1 Tax=Potamilus streckersoni TaxID=2493646 RepID=A0AAE0W431_9BIVA|nr:hypothetical protein CHS0354_027210 [Potamilus streckersoni]
MSEFYLNLFNHFTIVDVHRKIFNIFECLIAYIKIEHFSIIVEGGQYFSAAVNTPSHCVALSLGRELFATFKIILFEKCKKFLLIDIKLHSNRLLNCKDNGTN